MTHRISELGPNGQLKSGSSAVCFLIQYVDVYVEFGSLAAGPIIPLKKQRKKLCLHQAFHLFLTVGKHWIALYCQPEDTSHAVN